MREQYEEFLRENIRKQFGSKMYGVRAHDWAWKPTARSPVTTPAGFSPTVFAITHEEDRPELQKYRNHLKRVRRERAAA